MVKSELGKRDTTWLKSSIKNSGIPSGNLSSLQPESGKNYHTNSSREKLYAVITRGLGEWGQFCAFTISINYSLERRASQTSVRQWNNNKIQQGK